MKDTKVMKKVNEIRFRVCEMILNGDYVDEKNLESIKNEVANKHEKIF